ncbi:MAG: NADPH-dependent FMN reductase [Flavobacteriaceae bacterium]|nr:NADPH-dependent FMN reductase [Flavobacteriaceae bacterium]
MQHILAICGSNSRDSINRQLTKYCLQHLDGHSSRYLELMDFDLPLYSIDLEGASWPDNLKDLLEEIKNCDALIIAANEHNGSISAFFKNILDWLSRIEYKFLEEKKVFVLTTSPGKRGGQNAQDYLQEVLPRYGAEVYESFAFPEFNKNFVDAEITDTSLKNKVHGVLNRFTKALS